MCWPGGPLWAPRGFQAAVETDCPILVDPENSEAMASAMVLPLGLTQRDSATAVQK